MTKQELISALTAEGWKHENDEDYVEQLTKDNSIIYLDADNNECACTVTAGRSRGLARVADFDLALAWALRFESLAACQIVRL